MRKGYIDLGATRWTRNAGETQGPAQADAVETLMTSEAPGLRPRFTLRLLLGVVAVVAVILAMFVTNARMRVDWANPRVDDVTAAGAVTLVEAVLLYYCVLAMVIVIRRINPAKRRERLRRLFVYGAVIVIAAILTILGILDDDARGR
jgi:amino acid transporter